MSRALLLHKLVFNVSSVWRQNTFTWCDDVHSIQHHHSLQRPVYVLLPLTSFTWIVDWPFFLKPNEETAWDVAWCRMVLAQPSDWSETSIKRTESPSQTSDDSNVFSKYSFAVLSFLFFVHFLFSVLPSCCCIVILPCFILWSGGCVFYLNRLVSTCLVASDLTVERWVSVWSCLPSPFHTFPPLALSCEADACYICATGNEQNFFIIRFLMIVVSSSPGEAE